MDDSCRRARGNSVGVFLGVFRKLSVFYHLRSLLPIPSTNAAVVTLSVSSSQYLYFSEYSKYFFQHV